MKKMWNMCLDCVGVFRPHIVLSQAKNEIAYFKIYYYEQYIPLTPNSDQNAKSEENIHE